MASTSHESEPEPGSPAPVPPTAEEAFNARMQRTKIDRIQLNHMILDYLVKEGFAGAASNFASEAGLPKSDESALLDRIAVRDCINDGRIEEAMQRLDRIDQNILASDDDLRWSLLKLQFIELINVCLKTPNGDVMPAVQFASENLAPRAPTDSKYLKDLELAMSLLILRPEHVWPAAKALLDPKVRYEVAARVNAAILVAQHETSKCRLTDLLETRVWAENIARKSAKCRLPKTLPLGLYLEDKIDTTGDTVMAGTEL